MAKESLFNVLNNLIDFDGLKVLDCFAGTGSISFEFASRGAGTITAVDINHRCVEYIKKTAGELGFDRIKAYRGDVFKFLARQNITPVDIVFSDAPYDLTNAGQLPDLIIEKGWLKKNAWLVVEHPKEIDFTRHKYFIEKRNYGKVHFSFFQQE
jgi:16S rRNA (guanine966-N2)-methyltransferase